MLILTDYPARIADYSDEDLIHASIKIDALVRLVGRDTPDGAILTGIEDELIDEQGPRGLLPNVFAELKA